MADRSAIGKVCRGLERLWSARPELSLGEVIAKLATPEEGEGLISEEDLMGTITALTEHEWEHAISAWLSEIGMSDA